jgi:hypothetical protein
MLRITAIALATVATVGIASLASPTPAAAHGWKGHHHHHWHGHHFHARPIYAGCWRKVWIELPYGGGFFRTINVCR